MAKVLVLFLAIVLVWFFYPFRDLYVRDPASGSDYQLVARGFWTLAACREEAGAREARDYRCRKRSGFSAMTSTANRYEASGDKAQFTP